MSYEYDKMLKDYTMSLFFSGEAAFDKMSLISY